MGAAAVRGAIVVFALALAIVAGPAQEAQAARRMLFYDHFTTTLASSKWNVEDYGPGGYQACCLTRWNQYYTSANVFSGSGALRLVAGADYTSGAVTTEGKFSFRYGTLSIRAKLPSGPGLWPALWLLPNARPAPGQLAGSEIDLMEELGRDPHTVYFTVWQGASHMGCHYSGPDFSAAYHTFTLNWSPGRAQWLIDGVTRCTLRRDVSNQAMFLLMNVAIGRPDNWGGAPTAATHFPQEMDVSWVRVTG
jgi:beta-glucanase (GH16 family)